jgi:hypothetical protein
VLRCALTLDGSGAQCRRVVEVHEKTLLTLPPGQLAVWLAEHIDPPRDSPASDSGVGGQRAHGRAQKVLAAFPPLAIPHLERVLGGSVGFLPVHSLSQAKALLQSNADDISLVACGVHFDESRMFDLLRYVRESFPRIPVVCCRVLEMASARISIQPIALSAASLGAVTFFDLPGRAKEVGRETAEQEFRGVLLKHLPRLGG